MYLRKNHSSVVTKVLVLCLIVIALIITVFMGFELLGGGFSLPKSAPAEVPALEGDLRAMTVRTQNNADFPSSSSLTSDELKSELDQIVTFAATYGYNAIFFEAVPQCDAFYKSSLLPASRFWQDGEAKHSFFDSFDPLEYLTNAASEIGIQVYAAIDPLDVAASTLSAEQLKNQLDGKSPAIKNPEWLINNGNGCYLDPENAEVQAFIGEIAKELTEGYNIAGVVLSGVDTKLYASIPNYSQCIENISLQIKENMSTPQAQRSGIILNTVPQIDVTGAIQSGNVDFVVLAAPGDTSDTQVYSQQLHEWSQFCSQGGVLFYPLFGSQDETAFEHTIERDAALAKDNGASGLVISNYGSLNTEARTSAYLLAASFQESDNSLEIDLTYPTDFEITRPSEQLITSYETYYITGTSDPSQPVMYQGEELESQTSTGLWGVQVQVPLGTNTYTFTQGGVTKTATIIRNQPTATYLNVISKYNLYPSSPELVLPGKELKVSCTAPYGGTVVASIGGLSVQLQPVTSAQSGVATTHQATIDLSSLAQTGQVKNLGPVTFSLNYNGMNNTQDSSGEVYLAGEGATPVAQMKFYTPVRSTMEQKGVYLTVLKPECVDYITENVDQEEGYYKLSCGGYVTKDSINILEGDNSAVNTISAISTMPSEKGDKIKLTGSARPAFSGQLDSSKLVLTLYNIAGFENMNMGMLEPKLCSSIEPVINEDGSVTLTFHFNEGVSINGFNVDFEGKDTIIYLKEKPKLQVDTAAPLTGITVVLDPGHGGEDPGALGVPSITGPTEKVLNLADALATQKRLQALGATVYITQQDETMTLNDRMAFTEKYDADVFISMHHNSLVESTNATDIGGIEVYYYNDQSGPFAQDIGDLLCAQTGRALRFTEQTYYRVTMLYSCPAVLVESGYITSPSEYENLADPNSMTAYAYAITDAVLKLFA